MIAGVLVEITNKSVDKVFDYLIPSNLINELRIGMRVLVPFGKMRLEGFVVEIKDKDTDMNLKEIIDIVKSMKFTLILEEEQVQNKKMKINECILWLKK